MGGFQSRCVWGALFGVSVWCFGPPTHMDSKTYPTSTPHLHYFVPAPLDIVAGSSLARLWVLALSQALFGGSVDGQKEWSKAMAYHADMPLNTEAV